MNGFIVLVLTLSIAAKQSNAQVPAHCSNNRYNTNSNQKCQLEDGINKQINMELRAFYEYTNLGNFFAHENYNLPHFSKYFLNHAKEELKHAQDLMQYQILRGAYVSLDDVAAPQRKSFASGCDAMKHAYNLEFNVTKAIEGVWRKAASMEDIHLGDYLETHFVTEQYESLKKLQDMIGTLKRLGICPSPEECCNKLGEFQFDKTVMKDLVSS